MRFFFALCAPANDRPGDATTGNVKPNHGTDCGNFFVSLSRSRRKIGGPTRRSAKGGWTPEEVRGLKI